VCEFVEEAFTYVNLDWWKYVATDPRYFRPTEVPCLLANPSAAKRQLGWEARVAFPTLVKIMMDADLEAAGLPAPAEGQRCIAASPLTWLRRP
jgi:GDPmannose 4,6-dehydratase